jgi:hypothetical protein
VKLALNMTADDRGMYNALPAVEDAHQRLKQQLSFSRFLSEFAELANEHSLLNRVGAFLLHRHFELGNGEIMLERFDSSSHGAPAYVSTASHPKAGEAAAVPSRWYLYESGDFRALEYSQDPGAAMALEPVGKKEFLDGYAGLLAKHRIEGTIGLSSTDRALLPWTPGRSYREQSAGNESVVQLVEVPEVESRSDVVQTTWVPTPMLACHPQSVCRTWCLNQGAGQPHLHQHAREGAGHRSTGL